MNDRHLYQKWKKFDMVKEEERKKHNNNGLILNYIKAKRQGEKVVENAIVVVQPDQISLKTLFERIKN